MHLLFDHHSRRRNKSSVTASMFRDGCTLLFIMPREDEHYRRSKQCSIDAVRFDQEICVRRILLCMIFFHSLSHGRRQDPIYAHVARFRVRASDY